MKLVFNIEKKHLIFFSVFLVLVFGVFTIAQGTYNEGTPALGVGHEELYADTIYPFNEDNKVHIKSSQIYVDNYDSNAITGIRFWKSGTGTAKINMKNNGELEFCNINEECYDLSDLIAGSGITSQITEIIEFEFSYDEAGHNVDPDCWTTGPKNATPDYCITAAEPQGSVTCPDTLFESMILENRIPNFDFPEANETGDGTFTDSENRVLEFENIDLIYLSHNNEHGTYDEGTCEDDGSAHTQRAKYSITITEEI